MKKKQNVEEGLPEWMGTYGDMVTLLLTFFIMLFSMATIEEQKYKEIAQSLKGRFAYEGVGEAYAYEQGDSSVDPLVESTATSRPTATTYATLNTATPVAESPGATATGAAGGQGELDDVLKLLEQAIKKYGLGDYVKIINDNSEITLRIDSIILFDSGSADIKKDGKSILKSLGNIIKVLKKDIAVQGHTDNVPMKSSQFPSNWELSTRRATNVVVYLIETCGLDPARLTATGNGEYHPILPNDTEANRAKNRRVDIVIEKKD